MTRDRYPLRGFKWLRETVNRTSQGLEAERIDPMVCFHRAQIENIDILGMDPRP